MVQGSAKYVSVGSRGTVWTVDANNQVFLWMGNGWRHVDGSLKQLECADY
jgi:hypothetical protein